jgi:hypothetical protein
MFETAAYNFLSMSNSQVSCTGGISVSLLNDLEMLLKSKFKLYWKPSTFNL